MHDLLTLEFLLTLGQVVLIDIALAADNAVVIAMAAGGLRGRQRTRAIAIGIAAATVLRIGFASVTLQLLELVGLVLAGGLLLLWVCWKMWCELHPDGVRAAWANWRAVDADAAGPEPVAEAKPKTLRQAVVQIVVADVSMSLDNVLAVAGAAREHPVALVFGLILSIGLMGGAAMVIARLLQRHKWIAYAGFLVVLFVALRMIWEGFHEVAEAVVAGL